jgi:hypothetical protein
MMALDWLFGAKPTPTVSATESSTTQWPTWYSQWINQLLGKASSVAGEPYQPYGQPRISPTSADTSASWNAVRSGIGSYAPILGAGQGMVQSAGGPFNEAEFQSYMNPYTSNVVNRIGELGGRNLRENLLPQVNDTFIRSGQFGSRGNFDLTGRALRDTQEAVLAEQGKALAGGFEESMRNYNAGMDRRLSSGQALGNLAQLGQGLSLQDAAALQSIGQQQEGKTQQSLDLAYQDFLEQRDWPRKNVEWMSSISRGINPPTSTTSTTTGPASQSQLAPNSLAQLAGTALGIYGLTGGFKKGGRVRTPRRSGLNYYKMAA